jgi:hypothetical protein
MFSILMCLSNVCKQYFNLLPFYIIIGRLYLRGQYCYYPLCGLNCDFVWTQKCVTKILILCPSQVLVCRRASADWWKWKYHRCQHSCLQSPWCKLTLFSSVREKKVIGVILSGCSQFLYTSSLPAFRTVHLFILCRNVEKKVLWAAYSEFVLR